MVAFVFLERREASSPILNMMWSRCLALVRNPAVPYCKHNPSGFGWRLECLDTSWNRAISETQRKERRAWEQSRWAQSHIPYCFSNNCVKVVVSKPRKLSATRSIHSSCWPSRFTLSYQVRLFTQSHFVCGPIFSRFERFINGVSCINCCECFEPLKPNSRGVSVWSSGNVSILLWGTT